jgi:alginate O-acetyltransferase complex protein AlgJ
MSTHTGLATAAAITFVCTMSMGGWQLTKATMATKDSDFPQTWLDFREGRTTGALEKQLDQKMPARPALIAFANSVRYSLTGGAGDQVRTGNDNWLFLTEELRFDNLGASNLNARANLIEAAKNLFEARGVKLIIALVPDKARVYAEKLPGKHYPAANAPRYADTLKALQTRGVIVVDLLGPLTQGAKTKEVYYRSDTHWNQAGAKISADAVAQAVNHLELGLEKTQFISATTNENTERLGDLIRLMGLESMPNALRPNSDIEAPTVTNQSSSGSSAGLFGDSNIEIALTGTSYSLRGNFHGFLQEVLSTKILNVAKDGGGFLQATVQYLNDEAFRTAPPKVVIWEVPERFLQTNLEAGFSKNIFYINRN